MEETYIVAVLTCAAPMITRGMEGLTNDQYQEMLFTRIKGILLCAAYYGYHTLVLGAWGDRYVCLPKNVTATIKSM